MSKWKHVSESDKKLVYLLNNPSFIRWIKGKTGPGEQRKWERWEEESSSHADLKRKTRLLQELSMEISDGNDVEEQLDRLQKRIDKDKKVLRLPSGGRHKGFGYRRAAASILLLIVAVGILYTYNTYNQQPQKTMPEPLYSTIEVGYGEKGALNISDGSSIRLNAHSSLRYSPEQFNTTTVEVWLEGEAYFSIVRNPDNKKRTFIVHTPDGDIRVLGTRFNVNTRFRRTGVVLEEGSVEVVLKDSLQEVTGQFLLEPGERAQFSSDQTDVQVLQVDTLLYTSWLNGKLVFEEAPLKDIIQNIEQTYGVSIEVQEQALLDKKISGSLRNPDLETLLEGLEEVLNLNIQQKSKDVYYLSEKSLNTD